MSDFFKFPHTPHLAWLGEGIPRDDKVLTPQEAAELLAGPVEVEEKVDGANLGFSVNLDGILQIQNRGQYIEPPFSGQFARLASWIPQHRDTLVSLLGRNLMLFGEWCTATHSLTYTELPDWFLAFDIYDRHTKGFWSSSRRNKLLAGVDLAVVPTVSKGEVTIASLTELISKRPSALGSNVLEGIVVRKDNGDWLGSRAKLVRKEFVQSISAHWSRKKLQWNRLSSFRES
ncbi:RNA ligase [Roseimicrobium gellanilyticum]|uniref:RNA ligase n=1 Tax=Roseimicrobium gellanilyticum TaxID=748857 RepID=A0A366HGL1_9BACT|nr:RNA ligase [Roseimicrobium gellanilyticum]